MTTRLRLLDEVSWEGRVVPGERSHALLAALVAARGGAVSEGRLAELVWGPDDQPAAPAKALQVVVSRTRTQTAADVVLRAERGYRLGLGADDVDAARLVGHLHLAQRAEADGDLAGAREHATAVLALAVAPPGTEPGPLAELRATARHGHQEARSILGRASSAVGAHAEALPLLLADPEPDEVTLAALLASEAAVRGAPAALARYEQHREHVRDTLGVDPGPELQRVHAALLAADSPVRSGLRFETTSLVGRDADLKALREAVAGARVVSILGPGGLGKTRLAHLLGREAEQPVVHFVELVGVTSPDDVVDEVGSALGVRDSVRGRRVLTVEQQRDVRSRIAAQLDQAPTLLVLDNCEHVVGAVAELVAFLVATTRTLRVVTTTRAPLAIAAERVFPLGQLDDDAATTLFRERALAARPGVRLDDDAVLRVVRRLDGLPLAVELAAARVRAMAVDDIDRRLDDRFALLRGTDRGAPDRHQTLLAVIDWSWNLLGEHEQRSLARLSAFQDGFALAGAEALVGPGALDVVESLVDQSLLDVVEVRDGVRYRMLETVREFGRLRLASSGEADDVRSAHHAWAVGLADAARPLLYSRRQFEAVDLLSAEEGNLADVLREALADDDAATTFGVLAALGTLWTIKGEHPRVMALTGAVEDLLATWTPPADVLDVAVQAAVYVTLNNTFAGVVQPLRCRALLAEHGADVTDPAVRALAAVMTTFEPDDVTGSVERLLALQTSPDRRIALLAHQWSGHQHENAGDPERAIAACAQALALWQEDDGPWQRALLLVQLAELEAQLGRTDRAAAHALNALPVLDRLEADDDAIGARAILAYAAMGAGRLDEAAALVEQVAALDSGGFGADVVAVATAAELALVRGDVDEGLALYRHAAQRLAAVRFPGMTESDGFEPWTLFGDAAVVVVHALHARGDAGVDAYDRLRSRAARILAPQRRPIDYPASGLVLYALGAWGLLREAVAVEDAVRLLALADGFAYSRFTPSLAWENVAEPAERLAPGLLAAVRAELGTRRGPELLDEARALITRLHGEGSPVHA